MNHVDRHEDEDDWRKDIDWDWNQEEFEDEEEWNNQNGWDEDDDEEDF